ncbi:MAG: hypothetical protein JWM61_2050, partial [Micrococcaceae bacterium]|nr:hypothetical protein [Micrococcaceae bacterium]
MISSPSGRRRHLVSAVIALLLLTGCLPPADPDTGFPADMPSPAVTPPPAPTVPEPGDVGVEDPSHVGTPSPSGTKRATSALWFTDGLWWGNLWDTDSSDFHIFRFDAATSSWVDTGVATETRASTHHDVLWDGTTLNVASYRFVA